MYAQFDVSFSLSSFISHSGQTADPLNRYAKALKEVSSKRKKTEADFEQLAKIEFEAGLYLNKAGQVIIPGRVIEAALAEGAKKSREGKAALSSTFVDNDPVIEYDGGPLSLQELLLSEEHRLAVPVRVGTARVVRTRPIFHNVRGTFRVSLETSLANEAQLRRWIDDALNQVGIGDWRPRHGRGEVTNFVRVEQTIKLAA
jgi:hypothetical protein